jgi:uncharacterized protein YndB with AHSA1/START domain
MTIKHDTFTFTKTLHHPPSRIYRAFTTNEELEKWSPPDAGMNMRIHEGQAVPGNRMVWTCGPGEAEGVRVLSDYFHAEENRALLYSEAVYMVDALLSVALITVTLAGDGPTELEIRAQVSATDPEMLGGYEHGWNQSIENLASWLGGS